MMTMKRVVILDEFLENKTGHYYEYDKTVMESLKAKGIECVLYTKDTLDEEIRTELNARPYFQYNPKSSLRAIPILGPFLYRFYTWKKMADQLMAVIDQELQNDRDTHFFAPNIFWYNVWPYAKALKGKTISAQILFRTSVLEAIDISERYKPLIFKLYDRAQRLFQNNKSLQLVTDSEVIATQYQQKYNTSMKVLPIPHVFEMDDLATGTPSSYRLYLPGPARIEKGVELITGAMELLQQQHPEVLKNMVLCMQFFGEKEKAEMDAIMERLKKIDLRFEVLGKLSSEEYKQQFGLADIIVIPYLNSRGYKARTSGVLAEAIAACKPFITSKDSWMDAQVKNYKTGLAVSDQDPQQLADAMLSMMNDYSSYKTQANAAKTAWLRFHSKEKFAEVFMGR